MNKYSLCIDYLRAAGADSKKHSARTLLVHLERTFRILDSSGQPDHVCFAGLMHSVYGTSIFKSPTIPSSDRENVKQLIGELAENLVWMFCQLDRPEALKKFAEGERLLPLKNGTEFWDLSDPTDFQAANELLSIEAANLLDQQTLWRNLWLIPHARSAGMLSEEGYCVLRTTKRYSHEREQELQRMLDAARQGARAKLIQKINSIRINFSSLLIGGEDIRKLKLQQALLYTHAKSSGSQDALHPDQISLISNFATSYGKSMDESVEVIMNACNKFDNILIDSEILKDKISGKLSLANTLSDIDCIRKEIDLIAF